MRRRADGPTGERAVYQVVFGILTLSCRTRRPHRRYFPGQRVQKHNTAHTYTHFWDSGETISGGADSSPATLRPIPVPVVIFDNDTCMPSGVPNQHGPFGELPPTFHRTGAQAPLNRSPALPKGSLPLHLFHAIRPQDVTLSEA